MAALTNEWIWIATHNIRILRVINTKVKTNALNYIQHKPPAVYGPGKTLNGTSIFSLLIESCCSRSLYVQYADAPWLQRESLLCFWQILAQWRQYSMFAALETTGEWFQIFFFISRNMTRMNYGTISFLIFMCDYASVKDNQTRKTVRAVIASGIPNSN